MKAETLKKEYCDEYGYEVFSKYNNNNYTLFLEDKIIELTEQLRICAVMCQRELLMETLTSRVLTIKSEPDGIVRETMIDNLLVDINCT